MAVTKLDSDDIARIRRNLIRSQLTKPLGKKSSAEIGLLSTQRTVKQPTVAKPLIEHQPLHNQLTLAQRREEYSKFTPPVPLPIRFVNVTTMDMECELWKCDKWLIQLYFVNSIYIQQQKNSFFSVHALIVQIQNEHSYSRWGDIKSHVKSNS